MAGKDRTQTRDLTGAFLQTQDLKRAGLFAIVRQLEARALDKPRLGKAKRPEHSIVDLAQSPLLGFAGQTLDRVEQMRDRSRLRGYWLGLTGTMGPLPAHLTEFAYLERLYAKKHPFGDWLDMLAGRMLQLFYRAWAETQPTAQADRPDDDKFSQWLAALSGGMEGVNEQSSFFARARVHYAALFSGSRSAIALQDGLSHLLGQPVRVIEYIPKWRQFEPEDQTRLGQNYATLGSDMVLGRSVFSAADAFRVVVRATSIAEYRSLLPGGERFNVAAEAIEAFKPSHLEWDLCVEIDDLDAPAGKLDGRSPIGWASWMKLPGPKRPATKRRKATVSDSGNIRADAHLRKSSMKKRKPAP